jgi:uncharacterized delta-60 repeat protein
MLARKMISRRASLARTSNPKPVFPRLAGPGRRNTKRILDSAVEALETRQLLSGGTLDPTFGSGGIVVQDFNGMPNYGAAAVLVAGGKILVAGTYGELGATDICVSRYNADGSLDTTFGGGDGIAILDVGSGEDGAYAMALDASGNILVAGQTVTSNGWYDMVVARFNADGAVDTSFGTDGVVSVDFSGDFDVANSVAVQADGKILVGGSATVNFNGTFALVRLNADGSLDSGFGVGGKVSTDLSDPVTGYRYSGSFAIAQVGGQIVLAGYATDFMNADAALVWYNADGSLNHTMQYEWGRDDDTAMALAVDADGKLLVAGYSHDQSSSASDFAVMRVLADGSMDGSFNGGMVARTSFSGGWDMALSVAIDGDGNIVLAGKANGDTNDYGVAKYLSDGTLDSDFGTGGHVRIDAGGLDDMAHSVLITGAGKIVVVGTSTPDGTGYDAVLIGLTSVVPNVDPVANAGGPYSVDEGGNLSISGAASSDSDGHIVSYEWDFNYDGSSFDVDATGMNVDFLKLDGPVTRTVALRVTDDRGGVSLVTTTVNVNNVAPVASVSGTTLVQKNKIATFQGAISDYAGDTHMVKWDFGDGTSTGWMAAGSDGALKVGHAYNNKGVYKVTFTVMDDDGAVSSAGMNVEVQNSHVFYDGTLNALVVQGTEIGDTVSLRNTGANKMEILMNGVSEGIFEQQKVVIFGTGGNDVIKVGKQVSGPVEVFGGDGNDAIFGGDFDATLHGDAGNDVLIGGKGHNLLDGGDGHDVLIVRHKNKNSATLMGGAGNDILRGGGGDDLLDGGDGDDHLNGRDGKDVLKGGLGNDKYVDVESKDVVDDPDMKPKPKPEPEPKPKPKANK